MSIKYVVPFIALSLAACGGSSDQWGFSTQRIFSDNAGIAKGYTDSGYKVYAIMPNVVAEVAAVSSSGPSDPEEITDYSIIAQVDGYNIREGVLNGRTVLFAEEIGSEVAAMAYMYDNTAAALAVYARPLTNMPNGSQTYSGLYFVGHRASGWTELGSMDLNVNFNSETFTISAQSDDTTLSGSGFLEASTGTISGSNLAFFDVDNGNYSASALGAIGGNNASEIGALWYTNDTDGNPDFVGGIHGTK